MQITAVQVRAAYDALGLDHDLTLGVTISPGYIHVTTAETGPEGHPIVIGGVLQRVNAGVETREEEVPNVDA